MGYGGGHEDRQMEVKEERVILRNNRDATVIVQHCHAEEAWRPLQFFSFCFLVFD